MNPHDAITVTIKLRTPWDLNGKVSQLELSPDTYKSLQPLGKNHDFWLDPLEMQRAAEQLVERRNAIKMLSQRLAGMIEEMVFANDPRRGHPKT